MDNKPSDTAMKLARMAKCFCHWQVPEPKDKDDAEWLKTHEKPGQWIWELAKLYDRALIF